MNVPILFQSLDRINGKEGRSKLLHTESRLYKFLKALKAEISEHYAHKGDRMDLHIEITKNRTDARFSAKAESINGIEVDLSDSSNWGYLGRAFVLWTPDVMDYGKTHATVTFFGDHPKPELKTLLTLVEKVLKASAS